MCVHAQLQTEDRYLSNRMVGENIFDLFPASASGSLRAGFSTCGADGKDFAKIFTNVGKRGIVRLLCDFDEPIRRLPRYDPAEEYFLLYQ